MQKDRRILGAGAALGIATILAVGVSMGEAFGAGHKKMQPCCDDASIAYSKSLWAALTEARLVGASAINTRPYEGQAPHEHLKAVTVMFKREAGYDTDNADWFWAKYKPDGSLDSTPRGLQLAGRVMKGADKGCIACHSAADGKDYLFINDK